jgi:hypothetical protein
MFKDLYDSYCKSWLNKDSLVKTRKKINKDENKLKKEEIEIENKIKKI